MGGNWDDLDFNIRSQHTKRKKIYIKKILLMKIGWRMKASRDTTKSSVSNFQKMAPPTTTKSVSFVTKMVVTKMTVADETHLVVVVGGGGAIYLKEFLLFELLIDVDRRKLTTELREEQRIPPAVVCKCPRYHCRHKGREVEKDRTVAGSSTKRRIESKRREI
ncbi:hypothetical protein GQR58_027174 [Nymphon striatum]|nr:hypothetical protein GQR58_027174 [Nymphon striatum]